MPIRLVRHLASRTPHGGRYGRFDIKQTIIFAIKFICKIKILMSIIREKVDTVRILLFSVLAYMNFAANKDLGNE